MRSITADYVVNYAILEALAHFQENMSSFAMYFGPF